eukprot:TRINITY_DN8322_c0_g1_i1.p1 TRINITY_DN8322_c0_g1~~TRINITY_DN8322_c0_g1_i1.p1  ORF type:complete len:452 (-),score=63.47 TRINITY_DN8322_c0_g1_i1:113-1468(-)
MHEIVHIQVGQGGNQVGCRFWEAIAEEHGIDAQGAYHGNNADFQLERLNVYFNEISSSRYVPRSVMVDVEMGTMDTIRQGRWGTMYRPDAFVSQHGGYLGNRVTSWATAFYSEGAELADSALDVIRAEVERCDSLQGFQFCHSLGGNTGAAMGTLLMSKVREEYPDRMVCTYTLFPSPLVSDTVIEPYNATLALHQLVENADMTFCLDNEALYDICFNTFKLFTPTYGDLNRLVASIMSVSTATLRLPVGELNSDLRRVGINHIPFPRLHFFLMGCSSLAGPEERVLTVQEMLYRALHPRSISVACDLFTGKHLAASVAYRGKATASEVEEYMGLLKKKRSSQFVDWIPDNFKYSLCRVPFQGRLLNASLIANNTCIQTIFGRIHKQFSSMFKRRAFLHWYTGEGMDEMEFTEAESNMVDLIQEYQQYQNAQIKDDCDDGALEEEEEEEKG